MSIPKCSASADADSESRKCESGASGEFNQTKQVISVVPAAQQHLNELNGSENGSAEGRVVEESFENSLIGSDDHSTNKFGKKGRPSDSPTTTGPGVNATLKTVLKIGPDTSTDEAEMKVDTCHSQQQILPKVRPDDDRSKGTAEKSTKNDGVVSIPLPSEISSILQNGSAPKISFNSSENAGKLNSFEKASENREHISEKASLSDYSISPKNVDTSHPPSIEETSQAFSKTPDPDNSSRNIGKETAAVCDMKQKPDPKQLTFLEESAPVIDCLLNSYYAHSKSHVKGSSTASRSKPSTPDYNGCLNYDDFAKEVEERLADSGEVEYVSFTTSQEEIYSNDDNTREVPSLSDLCNGVIFASGIIAAVGVTPSDGESKKEKDYDNGKICEIANSPLASITSEPLIGLVTEVSGVIEVGNKSHDDSICRGPFSDQSGDSSTSYFNHQIGGKNLSNGICLVAGGNDNEKEMDDLMTVLPSGQTDNAGEAILLDDDIPGRDFANEDDLGKGVSGEGLVIDTGGGEIHRAHLAAVICGGPPDLGLDLKEVDLAFMPRIEELDEQSGFSDDQTDPTDEKSNPTVNELKEKTDLGTERDAEKTKDQSGNSLEPSIKVCDEDIECVMETSVDDLSSNCKTSPKPYSAIDETHVPIIAQNFCKASTALILSGMFTGSNFFFFVIGSPM